MKIHALSIAALMLVNVSCKSEKFYKKETVKSSDSVKPSHSHDDFQNTGSTGGDHPTDSDTASSSTTDSSGSSGGFEESTDTSTTAISAAAASSTTGDAGAAASDSSSVGSVSGADSSSASSASSTTGSSGSVDSTSSSSAASASSSTTGSSGSVDSTTSSSSSDSSTTATSTDSSSSAASTTGGDGTATSTGSDTTSSSSDSSASSAASADASAAAAATAASTTGGAGVETQIDSFTQKAEKAPIDILWIVDDSGSMAEEQASLAQNFDLFIKNFVTEEIDFNMAITTTDPGSRRAGIMKNPAGSLDLESYHANADQFFSDFENYVQVGINGSGTEEGLNAIEKFNVRYPSFLRQDSYLAIIIVTDEEDQSPLAVTDYVNQLKALKKAEYIKTYPIVDFTPDAPTSGIMTGHVRYQEFLDQLSGEKGDITGNFAETLTKIGDSISKLSTSFPLSKKAVASTLSVKVDGVATTSYVYDAANNVVNFEESAAPRDGARVEISYEVE